MTDLSNISNTPNDNLSSVLEALKTEQSRRQTENKLAYYKPYRVQKYWPARVTEPHIVVVLVPKVGTTAFACRYKNKLCVIDFRICHRLRTLRWEPSAGSSRRVSLPYLQSRTPNLPIVEPVREIVVCFSCSERILLETDTSLRERGIFPLGG